MEHGELAADSFLAEISDMVSVCQRLRGHQGRGGAVSVGQSSSSVSAPRRGSNVTESKKGYFCERSDCKFGLWRDNKFLTAKKINLTKKMVSSLPHRPAHLCKRSLFRENRQKLRRIYHP